MSQEPATVQRWLQVLGDRGVAEDGRRIEAVHEFCTFYGAEPDELVASLFRQTEAGPRIKLKKRREVMARIDEFEQLAGGRTDGNHVRSFLIHNGVAMTARPMW